MYIVLALLMPGFAQGQDYIIWYLRTISTTFVLCDSHHPLYINLLPGFAQDNDLLIVVYFIINLSLVMLITIIITADYYEMYLLIYIV